MNSVRIWRARRNSTRSDCAGLDRGKDRGEARALNAETQRAQRKDEAEQSEGRAKDKCEGTQVRLAAST
jgi:hypothetical protein